MFNILLSIIVPSVLLVAAPKFVELVTGKRPDSKTYLFVACLAYFVSWYIPSPLIEGKDTSFSTHFIGGGIFSGFFWLYVTSAVSWRPTWLQNAVGVFAVVSTLGVVNELFEFLVAKSGLMPRLTGVDTWWDLLANTLGAISFLIFYWLLRTLLRPKATSVV